jgi:hypothetical protein
MENLKHKGLGPVGIIGWSAKEVLTRAVHLGVSNTEYKD